jgi:hypothetical protein
MPYLESHDRRAECDEIVAMMEEIKVQANGDLNYILYKFCLRNVGPGYNYFKNYIGELTECGEEIRRRLLAKYEDDKIKDNGDVEYLLIKKEMRIE